MQQSVRCSLCLADMRRGEVHRDLTSGRAKKLGPGLTIGVGRPHEGWLACRVIAWVEAAVPGPGRLVRGTERVSHQAWNRRPTAVLVADHPVGMVVLA